MTSPTSEPGPDLGIDRLRASDADREQVASVLHRALGEGRLTLAEIDERLASVYAAKTLGDLRPIARDLPGYELAVPVQSPTPAVMPQAGTPAIRPIAGGPTSGHAVAVFSGVERKGPWTVPDELNVVAVFGGAEIDLTEATFSAPHTTIRVTAIFGGAQITVPPGVTVVSDVVALFGGVDDKSIAATEPGSPVVRLTGFALFGGVGIAPPKRRRFGRGR